MNMGKPTTSPKYTSLPSASEGTIEPSNSASTASVIGNKNYVFISEGTEGPSTTPAVGELSDPRTSKEIYVLDV